MKALRSGLSFGAGAAVTLALGWAAFPRLLYVKSAQPLAFNHAVHGSGTGLGCEDCHALHTDGTFAGIPGIAKCAECHAEPLGTTAAEKQLVEEYVIPGREIPWRVYAAQPDNVYFPHAVHVRGAALACERCHGPHGASSSLRPYEVNRISGYSRDIWGPSLSRWSREPWQGMKMSDCLSCHEASARGGSACLACHK
jgi:hypothetical protein